MATANGSSGNGSKHRHFTDEQKTAMLAEWHQDKSATQKKYNVGWSRFNQWAQQLAEGETPHKYKRTHKQAPTNGNGNHTTTLVEAIRALEIKRDAFNDTILELKRMAQL